MDKEQWFQPDAETRGFQGKGTRLQYHLWKFFGEHVFHLLVDPFRGLRAKWLRLFGAKIGKNSYIHSKCVIVAPYRLIVGDNCSIDQFVYINGSLKIGNNVSISSFSKMIAGGHDIRSRNFRYLDKVITIENGAFIGANSLIMGGVFIGTFACVGANSFVTHDIPQNSIAYGSPCQVHSERIPASEFEKYSF